MRVVIVVPARMGSSRFPGKPLAPILGKTMLEHVLGNALESASASEVVLASCDSEIFEAIGSLPDVRKIETSKQHVRASERTLEAAQQLAASGPKPDLVVMLQGDEPCITGAMIDAQVSAHFSDQSFGVSNLVGRIGSREEHHSSNSIKVLSNSSSEIVYMSRLPIPGEGHLDSKYLGKQVCSIAFSWDSLQLFGQLAESPLEIAESIDMLRFIESGIKIKAIATDARTHPVDVKSDIAKVERILNQLNEPGL